MKESKSMSTLLGRATRSLFPRLGSARLQLIAPSTRAKVLQTFSCVAADLGRHAEMIDRIQRFRSGVYRADGAIPRSDSGDATNHSLNLDHRSWHVLVTGDDEQILACLRYTHLVGRPILLGRLHLMRMVERAEPETARKLRAAVQVFLDEANRRGNSMSEVGGWATGPEVRNSVKGLLLVCACWFLAELLQDPLGLATATTRHNSAGILRRLGGFSLDCGGMALDAFFDGYHGCEMQILGFSAHGLASQYRSTAADITSYLRNAPVLTC
jgi:hypothetical protein